MSSVPASQRSSHAQFPSQLADVSPRFEARTRCCPVFSTGLGFGGEILGKWGNFMEFHDFHGISGGTAGLQALNLEAYSAQHPANSDDEDGPPLRCD